MEPKKKNFPKVRYRPTKGALNKELTKGANTYRKELKYKGKNNSNLHIISQDRIRVELQ